MNYAQQIKHPNWQRKRLEVLEYYNFECMECGAKESTLNIHHPFYKRGAMIWQYEIEELQCLCEKCHKEEHAIDEQIKKLLSETYADNKLRILGQLKGSKPYHDHKNMESFNEMFGFFEAQYINQDYHNMLVKLMIECGGDIKKFIKKIGCRLIYIAEASRTPGLSIDGLISEAISASENNECPF